LRDHSFLSRSSSPNDQESSSGAAGRSLTPEGPKCDAEGRECVWG